MSVSSEMILPILSQINLLQIPKMRKTLCGFWIFFWSTYTRCLTKLVSTEKEIPKRRNTKAADGSAPFVLLEDVGRRAGFPPPLVGGYGVCVAG